MFLVHKYSPEEKEYIDFNKDEINHLDIMCGDPAFPNMIVYGPEGSGKKTVIKYILENLYGKGINNLKEVSYQIPNSNGSVSKLYFKQSDFHIVIKPNNNANDRHLIQGVTKEYAKRNPISIITHNKPFKVILIDNIDNLSYYAQTSLRRTMEKYSNVCRFIMWSRNLSKVIDPLRSRCQLFRIRSPSDDDIFKFILNISARENIELDFDKCNQIMDKSNKNIRKILWNLQLMKYEDDLATKYDKAIEKLVYTVLLCDQTCAESNRKLAYSIKNDGVPSSKIIKDVVNKLIESDEITDKCKLDIVFLGTKYEHRLATKNKNIMHLDAFFIGITDAIIYDY